MIPYVWEQVTHCSRSTLIVSRSSFRAHTFLGDGADVQRGRPFEGALHRRRAFCRGGLIRSDGEEGGTGAADRATERAGVECGFFHFVKARNERRASRLGVTV